MDDAAESPGDPRELLDRLPSQLEVRIETPRGSLVKRSSEGGIDFVSPIPCPYNYGSVRGWSGGDGDPLDAVVLGRRRPTGVVVRLPVVGIVGFVDDGREDHKIVLGERAPTWREVHGLELFFRTYARVKRALRPRLRVRFGRPPPEATRYLGWHARREPHPEVA